MWSAALILAQIWMPARRTRSSTRCCMGWQQRLPAKHSGNGMASRAATRGHDAAHLRFLIPARLFVGLIYQAIKEQAFMEGIPETPATAGAAAVQSAPDSGYKWRVLASVVSGLFMVILDATVVNVALKALQQHYNVGTNEAQWVISLYTLALGIATPLSGYLGDRFGIKRIYLTGLALFAAGSALCGVASLADFSFTIGGQPITPLTFLIMARAIQGIGGGIALPLGTTLLFKAFPAREIGAAFGIFGIVLVFAPAMGPLLGGWLVDHNLLAWIFFLNIPIGIIGLIISTSFLRETPGVKATPADIPGIIFAGLGFGAVLYAASTAGEQGVGW